jgi:hypothetical protein
MGEMGEFSASGLSIIDLGKGCMVLAGSLEVGSDGVVMLSLLLDRFASWNTPAYI